MGASTGAAEQGPCGSQWQLRSSTAVWERAGGTELQREAAAKKLVVRWLEVFEAVHKLNHVESLRDVFFGATGRRNLQGSRSLRAADGAPGELMRNLFRCSEYVHLRGGNTSNTAP